jgi:DNA/RNA endonuclease YhcR with UshA esterase domain
MKKWLGVLLVGLCVSGLSAQEEPKVVTPDAAARLVNQQVTVEMAVKSAVTRDGVCFLNSHENFRDAANFTIFIGRELVTKFKDAKIEDPAAHFKGKVVRVKGKVTQYREKPQISLTKPEEITIVEKKP